MLVCTYICTTKQQGMRKFLIIYICILSAIATLASPKYEMRAVWLTTNWGLDWPSQPARNAREAVRQQEELCRLLDEVEALGFNTLFFQARIRGEVFYNSEIEPWSRIVSGKPGVSPGYDPLAFVVAECHRRGLECHAWMVSIPVGSVKQVKQQGASALPARHPEMCVKLKGEWYLNPGHPAVADYLASIAEEIAVNYDVDGIHLDYIRYPDEMGAFPDADTYQRYAPEDLALEDWRVENISHIVRTVCDVVKDIDEAIMVSTAPLGRYTMIEGMPPSEWCCTGGASQDVVQWMLEGYNDFVAPMMYYRDSNFFPYLNDWVERTDGEGYVVAGLGAYRMERGEGDWSLNDLRHQLQATRHYGAAGQAFFRLQHLLRFPDLAQFLSGDFYRYRALVPPMVKVHAPLAATPPVVELKSGYSGDTLVWQPVDAAVRYAVYAAVSDSVDIEDATNLVYTWVTDTTVVLPAMQYRSFAVTAIDAYRRETEPCYINARKLPHYNVSIFCK